MSDDKSRRRPETAAPEAPEALTRAPAVLEVAMEIALTPEILARMDKAFGPDAAQAAAMSTSVGGIGPLLRERIIAQAERGLAVVGVSLLYHSVWNQGWHDWNHLYLEREAAGRYLRETLEDARIQLNLPLFDGSTVRVAVWKAVYGKAAVYFLDCPEISDVVYPGAEDAPPKTLDTAAWTEHQRLKQSWLVGRGALALARELKFSPDIVIMSETPTLFAHPRLVADELAHDPLFARSKVIFNDHTPLEYAHPIWPESQLQQARMDPSLYKPFVKNGKIDVTQLLVAASEGVFGVARKHAQVMRAMPSLAPYSEKINYITNGVSQSYWQNSAFHGWEKFSDAELLRVKDKLKAEFIDWLWRRALLWPQWAKKIEGKAVILWTRRITSYKRLDILDKIFDNPEWRERFLNADAVLVVGGRVYQRDNVSEQMVYNLVEDLNHDEVLGERVVFLHNYNVWEAPRLFHGGDGSIMLSDDGREASATGFMKAQMNGGAVIANPDGAVPEFVFVDGEDKARINGFGVSYKEGAPDPVSFLDALEAFSAAYKDPARRAALVRGALAVTPAVSVDRTAREMVEFYEKLNALPAAV